MGQKGWRDGGDEGIRTPDLLLAKQALSQLSYTPGRQNSDQQTGGIGSSYHTRPESIADRWWWAFLDSNQGPQSYQDCALTN